MKKSLSLILVGLSLLTLAGCKAGNEVEYFDKPTDVVNPNPVIPVPDVVFGKGSLADLCDKLGIKLGAAYTKDEYFQNDSVKVLLTREFESVTFGNEMKQSFVVGSNGKYDFSSADEMLQYNVDCGVDLFGHVLGWHSQAAESYINNLIGKSAENTKPFSENWNLEKGSTSDFTSVSGDFGLYDDDENPAYVFAGEYSLSSNGSFSFSPAVEAGKYYQVSFWAKPEEEGGSLTLANVAGKSAATTLDTGWTKYFAVFEATAESDTYTVTVASNVAFDNFRVEEVEYEPEVPSSDTNYINPYAIGALDFEDYTLGSTGSDLVSNYEWSQFNGASYGTVSNEQHNSGSQSLKLDNGDGHCSNAWDIQAITPTFDVVAGTTYRIAWYSMANETADLQIDIREDGDAKAYKNSAWGNYPQTGTTWTYQYYDYTVEAGSTLSVAFYGGTSAVTYYIDDIQVFEPKYEGDYTNYLDPNNLLEDGDFELGTSGNWSTWTSYGEIISRNDPEEGANADYVHSAIYALKIDNSAGEYSGGDAWKAQWTNSYQIEVTGGTSYRIGLWAYSPDGYDTVQIEAVWDGGDVGTNYRQIAGITDSWSFIYIDLVAPDDATTLQIKIDGFYSVGTVYIDDVQVYVTPVDSYFESNAILTDDFDSYAVGATGSDLVSAGYTQCNGASYVTVTSDEAHSGSNSVKLANADGHCSNAWDIQLITPTCEVTAGQTYRISWYSKATEEADLQIDIREDGDAKAYKSSAWGNYDKCGTDWTLQTYDYTVEAGSTLSVAFYGGVAAVDYYLDDFQIYPVASTSAVKVAKRGYGKYPTWNRPAPAVRSYAAATTLNSFDTTTKLDGEPAADCIQYFYKDWVYRSVEHFADYVYGWDIVNETFSEDGNFRTTANTSDGFVWGQYYESTEAWVDKSFVYAKAAFEQVGKSDLPTFYINDYNLETSEAKRKAFCDYAANNDLVTGVGTQMHLDMSTSDLTSKIEASLKDLVATGKMVRISELDIACTDTDAQAELYVYIFDKYLEIVPEAQRGGITIWGINDKDSWIGESKKPLLWTGKKYEKKPAYEALYVYLCEANGIDPYSE